jgi:hypothetical protein
MKLFAKCLLTSIAALALAAPVVAQDLTDDATCLECHDGTERAAPADPGMPQVHNPEGGFFAEAHEMWSCVDCHDYVAEIPHAENVAEQKVDCLNCHDEVPKN